MALKVIASGIGQYHRTIETDEIGRAFDHARIEAGACLESATASYDDNSTMTYNFNDGSPVYEISSTSGLLYSVRIIRLEAPIPA